MEKDIIDSTEKPAPSHIAAGSVPNKDMSKVSQITSIQVIENGSVNLMT